MTSNDFKTRANSLERLAAAGYAKGSGLFGKTGEDAVFNYLFKQAARKEGKDFLKERAEESMSENGGQLMVDSDSDMSEAHSEYQNAIAQMSMGDFLSEMKAEKVHESYISNEDRNKSVADLMASNKSAVEMFGLYAGLKLTENIGGAVTAMSDDVGNGLDGILSKMDASRFKDHETKLTEDEQEAAKSKREAQRLISNNQAISGLSTLATIEDSYGAVGKEAVAVAFVGGDWDDAFTDFYLNSVETARASNKSTVNLTSTARKVYESSIPYIKVSDALETIDAKGDRLTKSQKDMYMFELIAEDKEMATSILAAYSHRVNSSNVGKAILETVKIGRGRATEKYSAEKPRE
ncbi:hypothetical protein KAR91_87840 [Candidatus Pacearchaeota archaeon]|nr:hypothetical protein [Candidatus Pacearchaeota archaeon]